MKCILAIFFFGLTTAAYCQSETRQLVDSGNYYRFFEGKSTIDWIRASEAVPIIIDELVKAGFSKAHIGIGTLVKVSDKESFVLTVSYRDKKKLGFVYETGHGFPISEKDRKRAFAGNPPAFSQVVHGLKGEVEWKDIHGFPTNTFFLFENCYWYEYGQDGKNPPVNRKVAEYVLRQDIRYWLKKVR